MIEDVVVKNEVRKYSYKCRNSNCRHFWIFEFEQIPTNRTYFYNGRDVPVCTQRLINPPSDVGVVDELHMTRPHSWSYSRCPKCDQMGIEIDEYRVKGTKTQKPCNDECTHARGKVCNCSCGGKNHGSAHIYANLSILTFKG